MSSIGKCGCGRVTISPIGCSVVYDGSLLCEKCADVIRDKKETNMELSKEKFEVMVNESMSPSKEFIEYAKSSNEAWEKFDSIQKEHQAIIDKAREEYDTIEKHCWNKFLGRNK
jgi:hypothetical protein